MEVPAHLSSLLKLSSPGALQRAWSVGQLLDAVVGANTSNGRAILTIAGQTLHAETPLALTRGERLQLQVTEIASQPVLKIVARQPPSPTRQEIQHAALREALPKQQPLARALAQLNAVAQATVPSADRTLQGVLDRVQRVMTLLPAKESLQDPVRLKDSVVRSGTFLENALVRQLSTPTAPATAPLDVKAALVRLAAGLRALPPTATAPPLPHRTPVVDAARAPPVPGSSSIVPPASDLRTSERAAETRAPPGSPEQRGRSPEGRTAAATLAAAPAGSKAAAAPSAAEVVDAALARISVNQLASLPAEDGRTHGWVIELAVHGDGQVESLDLLIENEEDRTDAGATRRWNVSVAFSLEPLGALVARLGLRGNTLDAGFWAERSATRSLMREQLGWFRAEMERQGLRLGHLQVLASPPRSPDPLEHLPQRLVNLQV